MKTNCPFCTIEQEGRTLKTSQHAHVIFSNPRIMPGHLLVIPKRHVQRLSQLSEEERNQVIGLVLEFQEKILAKLASGCDIRQNFKPYVANSPTHIDHLHIHLHPRELNDELHETIDPHYKPLYRALSEEETEKLFKLLNE